MAGAAQRASWLLLVALSLSSPLVGCGSQRPRQQEAARTTVFSSHRYGYSVKVPARWLTPDRFAKATKGTWDGVLYPLDPGVDTFANAHGELRVAAAARGVPPRTGLDAWTARVARGVPTLCRRRESPHQTELDYERAMIASYHCTDGYYVVNATALHDGRGFAIGWVSPTGSERKDRAVFDRVLESLTFSN